MDLKKIENLEILKKSFKFRRERWKKIENLEFKKKINSGTFARKLFQIY